MEDHLNTVRQNFLIVMIPCQAQLELILDKIKSQVTL